MFIEAGAAVRRCQCVRIPEALEALMTGTEFVVAVDFLGQLGHAARPR